MERRRRRRNSARERLTSSTPSSAAGRKETRNKYSEAQRRELGSGMRRGTAGGVRTGGLELELDGSPARKIHIFKYFSHGPQSPRHAALPPTACYPLRTYYLPGTCLGIAAGTPRVSGFLVTRCRFHSCLFLSFSLPLSFVTIRRILYYMARNTRVLCSPAAPACACVSRVSLYRTAPRSRESFCWSKRFDRTGKCNRRNRLHRCCDVVFDGRC